MTGLYLGAVPMVSYGQDYSASDIMSDPLGAGVETQSLDAAQDFDPGVLTNSLLSPNLWQGTSARRAARLLGQAPFGSKDPIVRDMLHMVVLSGGVPPQAHNAAEATAYAQARLGAVLTLDDTHILDDFTARNPDLVRSPLVQADLAFVRGESERACEIADLITTGRGDVEWVRRRALCHVLREEMSAAELSRDLLRSRDYDDPAYYTHLEALIAGRPVPTLTGSRDVIVRFMARRDKVGSNFENAKDRKAALSVLLTGFESFDLAQLQSHMRALAANPTTNPTADTALETLTLEAALSDRSARATASLFTLGQLGDIAALDGFIDRAVKAGVDEAALLEKFAPILLSVPAKEKTSQNLYRYALAAILANDVAELQSLYSALAEIAPRARIALAADALGGGFIGQGLGRDIEDRLNDKATSAQALEDAGLALALGAHLPDFELPEGKKMKASHVVPVDIWALEASAEAQSQAETCLRVAELLARRNSKSDLNIADQVVLIRALREVGLPHFAGQIAARSFLDPLKKERAR